MSSSQLLIHIGYPKTASTWLQNCIFQGEDSSFFPLVAGEGIQQFVLANEFSFSAETAREAFRSNLEEATRQGRIAILSNEILVGNQIGGKYWGKQVADRIFATFPSARILIIIREQKSMILSSYREYIKLGGTEKIERFLGTGTEKPGFGPICRLDFLQYDLLISYYKKLFSGQNILVLPFELLKSNQQAFVEKIGYFAGIEPGAELVPHTKKTAFEKPQNVGFKAATLAFRRRLNFFIEPGYFGDQFPPLTWRIAQKLSKVVDVVTPSTVHESIEKEWKQYINERTADTFRESNQRTSQLIGIDLGKFGYLL